MTKGGLLQDPGRILHDAAFQRATVIQITVIGALLVLSAFFHFVLRGGGSARRKSAGCYDADIAEIDSLIVYPVKSCRGVTLDQAHVSRKGFLYDRRWAVIKVDGLKKMALKDEPRLTHIIPTIDEDGGVLHLQLGEACDAKLSPIGIPLDAGDQTRSGWPLVEMINMYGDTADGRQAPLAPGHAWGWQQSPSEWVSQVSRACRHVEMRESCWTCEQEGMLTINDLLPCKQLLGYPVYLLQFEPASSKRFTFPVDKPPHDVARWDDQRATELQAPTKLEFQDIYPFLVTTRESLASVETQLADALATQAFKVDKEHWKARADLPEGQLSMMRFRPNIVLKSQIGLPAYPPFSEDSWETIWVHKVSKSLDTAVGKKSGSMPIHLVARCDRCMLTAVDPET